MVNICGQQVAEKVRQRRSRIAQRLSAPPGQTPIHTGDEQSGVKGLRLASSLAAALPAEWRVLARRGWAGENDSLLEYSEGILVSAPNGNCWAYDGIDQFCSQPARNFDFSHHRVPGFPS